MIDLFKLYIHCFLPSKLAHYLKTLWRAVLEKVVLGKYWFK